MSNLESKKCTQLQFSFLSELYLFIAIFFVPVCYLFVFSAFLCLSATLALCLFSFIFSQFSLSVCYSILSQISFLYLSYQSAANPPSGRTCPLPPLPSICCVPAYHPYPLPARLTGSGSTHRTAVRVQQRLSVFPAFLKQRNLYKLCSIVLF